MSTKECPCGLVRETCEYHRPETRSRVASPREVAEGLGLYVAPEGELMEDPAIEPELWWTHVGLVPRP